MAVGYLVCFISAKQNVLDLWRKDGLGVKLFGLTVGVIRFRLLMTFLRFDDVASEGRQQRKEEDTLYCLRELVEDCFRRCQESTART